MLKTEAAFYDSMSTSRVDPSKWKILGYPTGNGDTWNWEEPNARFESKNGGLAVTVDPFTRKHDHVHMFDDPKQLYGSTTTLPVSSDCITLFEVDMGAETYRSNSDDLRDGFVEFSVMDFSTGIIFDFVSTGQKIGAIYERLLIPGLTDEKTAFTYLIESPFSGIRTEPGKMHHYSVRLDAAKRRAEWHVDERPFFKVEGIPVALGEITLGSGLFTLKPIDPLKGSVSDHGQGATGNWKDFSYSFV